VTLSRAFGLGESGLILQGIGLGGDSLEFPSGAAPIVIVDAVQGCDYIETDFQNNPEDISGGIRVDVYWKEDGSRVWMNREDRTDQYDVDPPFSILGADWGNRSTVSGGAVTYQLGGIQFTPDGTRMMTLGSSTVQHVDMGTAFDITTAGASVLKFVTTSMNKFHWTDDGLTVYIYLAGATKHIVQYPVSSAFDVSTLNNIGAPFFDYSSDVASLNSMTLSADGRFVYGSRGSTGDELVSWELTTPFDITTATNFCVGPIVNVLSNMTDPRLIFYRRDNGDVHLYGHLKSGAANQRVKVFSPSPSPNLDDFAFFAEKDVSGLDVDLDSFEGLWVGPDGENLYTVRGSISVDDVFWFEMSTGNDISTLSFTEKNNADGQSPRGVALREDGSLLFIYYRNPTNPDAVFRWPLSTDWDVDTKGSRTSLAADFSNNPRGLWFKPDGSELYLMDDSDTVVYQFNLPTPWDFTGATQTNTFNYSGQSGSSSDLTFSTDGSKMYLCNAADQEIIQYNLGIAFDVSTAVFSGQFLSLPGNNGGTSPRGVAIRDNFLYVCYGDNEVIEQFKVV